LKSSGAAMVFVAYASQLVLMAASLALGFWILARTKPAVAEGGALDEIHA
jgi:hypothetical protein